MSAGVLRSGAIYGLANVISAGVPFLLLPILTRALAPEEYGEVVTFYLVFGVAMSVSGLSLHSAVGVRWLDAGKGDPRTYTATAVMLVLAATLATAFAIPAVVPHLQLGLKPETSMLAAVAAGMSVIQAMRFAVWQSQERATPAAVLQVTSACLNILLSLIAVLVLQMGGRGRILGATVTGLIIAAASIVSLLRERVATRVTLTDVRSLLRFGIPLLPHALAGTLLTSADRFAVSAKLGAGELGVYGAASQLGLVINIIADAAIKAYTPTMYRMIARDSIRSKLRIVAIAYLSIPVWIVTAFALWAGYLVLGYVLLGKEYLDAINLAIWFLLGGAATGVYLNVAGLFFFSGKTEWISVATMTAAAMNLLIVAGAVSRFGLVGGAVAYLASQVMLLVTAWILSCRIKPMPWSRPDLGVRLLLRQLKSVAS